MRGSVTRSLDSPGLGYQAGLECGILSARSSGGSMSAHWLGGVGVV